MAERLATWITIEDLKEIKVDFISFSYPFLVFPSLIALSCPVLPCTVLQIMGFNSVRLPIGYWNLMADPYRKYAPLNHRTSLKYIDWCFDTCEKVCGLRSLFTTHLTTLTAL